MILKVIPKWVTDGLTVAGGMLPVGGIAMLLHYMPIKKFLPYVMIGFVIAAYMKVPVLGIAIMGLAFGYIYYVKESKNDIKNKNVATNGDEGDDYDE